MRQNQWILEEMAQASERGIRVDVDGVVYNYGTSKKISKILEQGSYMLDYEGDMLGRIVALHVDQVEPPDETSYESSCEEEKK